AFTRVLERWPAVAAMEDPAGYLHRIAVNLFRSQYRRAATALKRAVGLGPPRDVFQQVEDRHVATHALSSLTPRQRAALVLTERELDRVEIRPFTLEGFHRRRDRKERNKRIVAGVVALVVAVGGVGGAIWALHPRDRSIPVTPIPTPLPSNGDIAFMRLERN